MTDYSVSREKVRRKDGELQKITTVHNRVKSGTGYVKFVVENGEATVDKFSPMRGGSPFTKVKGDGGLAESMMSSLHSGRTTMMADMDQTLKLLATASHYVEENYDVQVEKTVWMGVIERQ